MSQRRKLVIVAIGVVYALIAAFVVEHTVKGNFPGLRVDASSLPLPEYLVPRKLGPYVVGLSDSSSDSSWNAEMVASFKYAAAEMKSQGTLRRAIVTQAIGGTADQIQQLQKLIAKGVDAILIDASSATALDRVIRQAHEAGILVVSFGTSVTSPYAVHVGVNQADWGTITADWLVKELGGKGDIIVLNGSAGNRVSSERWRGAAEVFAKHPKITILTKVDANRDRRTARRAVARLLSTSRTVDGVWSQDAAMTLGAISAFRAADRPLVPMTGAANNGLLKFWKRHVLRGFSMIAPGIPTGLSATALDLAVRALQGDRVAQDNEPALPVITAKTLDEQVRMNMPNRLWLPTSLPHAILRRLFGKA